MRQTLEKIVIAFNFIRCFPHIILFYTHANKHVISIDTLRWLEVLSKDYNRCIGFVYLLSFHPEFRNLFYYRVGAVKYFLNVLCPKMSTLFIATPTIGEGLFIQHGFATIIAAQSIGKNCWINQQVTIGFSSKTDCPVIKDNVKIYAGAKVIGNIVIEENSIIGANAVVVKNVPKSSTVVGIPAHVVKKHQNN
ncbi:MAG: serine acetyltransferase, partial [Sphingobacteriales bacterium]